MFETESRDMVRQTLAHNLCAVICRKLIPSIRKEVGVIQAVEVMLTSPTVRNFIEESRDGELNDVIVASRNEGMQDFNMSLMELIESEMIDPRVAYSVSPNPDELKMRMKGIDTKRSGLLGR